jgi:hypothetical protein
MYGIVPSPIDQALYLIRQHYRKTVPEGEDNNTYSTYLFLEIKNQPVIAHLDQSCFQ